MMKSRIKILALFLVLAFGTFLSNNASALSESEIYRNWLANAMARCYSPGHMTMSIDVRNFNNFKGTILNWNDDNVTLTPPEIGGNKLSYSGTPQEISCKEIFLGDQNWEGRSGTFTGLFELSGKAIPERDSASLTDSLKNIGYTKVEVETSKQICLNVEYTDRDRGGNDYISAGSACFNEDEIEDIDETSFATSIIFNKPNTDLEWHLSLGSFGSLYLSGSSANTINTFSIETSHSISNPVTFKEVLNELVRDNEPMICSLDSDCFVIRTSITEKDSGSNDVYETMSMVGYQEAYNMARRWLGGNSSLYSFSDKDKYDLYQLYLTRIYNVSRVDGSVCKKKSELSGPIVGDERWTYFGGGWYRISWARDKEAYNVSVFTSSHKNQLIGTVDFDGLLREIWELNLEENAEGCSDDPGDNRLPGVNDVTPGSDEPSEITCMSSGAADTLGWIVCPVLTWLGDAAKSLYDNYIEPALRVEPTLFQSDKPTEEAWGIFRNIANTIFIVLLLLVIVSQLTGYGIDNYGVKKILPKLVVAAVLINLSYIICEIAVDISNIVGNGIQEFFDGLGVSAPTGAGGVTWGSVGSTAITGVAVLSALVLGIWGSSIVAGTSSSFMGGLILMLLMAAVSVVVSIVFLFIILASRQAAIIVLTILSPLAFACFILPNTKKVFDKWWKFGWSLLLVYPIAGALVGGGNFVSELLLEAAKNSNSFFLVFTAMIVGVVPIFFIPSVLKNSLAAAGNIGAKLSGMGKTLGHRAGLGANKFVGSRDTFRRADNWMGRHSLSARTRTQAVKNTAALMKEHGERRRYGSPESMERVLAATNAAEEAKAYDEATGQTLSLLQSGGFTEGVAAGSPLNLENAHNRMKELEGIGGSRAYTNNEKNEMAALARYMASQKGGASKLAKTIRESGGSGSTNANFMSAMSDIYKNDGAVQAKMKEKDQAVGRYMDRGNFSRSFTDTADAAFMAGVRSDLIKSHEAGLNQGGTAVDEYISGLDQRQSQEIWDDSVLLNSLDVDVREKFINHAKGLGLTGPSIQQVQEAGDYTDSAGNIYRIHKMPGGEIADEGGFTGIDTGKLHPR